MHIGNFFYPPAKRNNVILLKVRIYALLTLRVIATPPLFSRKINYTKIKIMICQKEIKSLKKITNHRKATD